MRNPHENPVTLNALDPWWSGVSQNGREILLLIVVLGGAISVLVPSMFQSQAQIGFPSQLLIGLVFLVLILTLHLASQRKLLREVSTALIGASSYVTRMERFSFVDPQTQLFNRNYLDQLFNQQLKWLNRTGESATLLLLEVLPNRQKSAAKEIVIEVASVLRSNFRGSDFILRNSTDQFLVLLPDTTACEAQHALKRLTDKVDYWNLQNETSEMALWHQLGTCSPGGNLWEKLLEMEEWARDKPDPRADTLVPRKSDTSTNL